MNVFYFIAAVILGAGIGALLWGGLGALICMCVCGAIMKVAGNMPQQPLNNTLYQARPETNSIDINHEIVTVESFTNPAHKYFVDKNTLTCSCPDFISSRSTFDVTDPRRFCKHLIKTIIQDPEIFLYYSVFQQEIEKLDLNGRGFIAKDMRYMILIDDAPAAVFTEIGLNDFNDGNGVWMDIYYNGIKYGYNPLKDVWTRNSSNNPDKEDIRRFIRKEICKFDGEFI